MYKLSSKFVNVQKGLKAGSQSYKRNIVSKSQLSRKFFEGVFFNLNPNSSLIWIELIRVQGI